MKTNNYGVNMTEKDIEALIAKKEEKLAHQQARMENLKQSIKNSHNDLKQLKYTLQKLKLAGKRKRPVTFIPRHRISDFFARISRLYNHLCRRLHCNLNYTWFCLVLTARYSFESRTQSHSRNVLAPSTVLSYFKRERGERC